METGQERPRYEPRRRRRRRRRLKKHYRILLGVLAVLAVAGLASLLVKLISGGADGEPEAVEALAPVRLPDPIEAEPEPEERPFALSATQNTAQITGDEYPSEFIVFADAESGEILAERNSDRRMYPASMTKVLTLLVAAEHMPEKTGTFTMTREAADYCYVNKCSVVGYEVGEQIPVIELFYGCILCSGADACLGLAECSAGSHEAFTVWMNEKLEELGLSETTRFTNCVGIYDDEHYTTARDMAAILRAAMQDEFCRTVLTTPIYMSEPTPEHPEGQVLSNWFLRRVETQDSGGVTVLGGKKGYVTQSGNCAASCGTDEAGHTYLCVTGKGGTEWQVVRQHAALFRQYAYQQL